MSDMNGMQRVLERDNTNPHLSRARLDLFVLDTLDEQDRHSVQAHLDSCKACKHQLNELQAEQESWQQQAQPKAFLARLEAMREAPQRAPIAPSLWDQMRAWIRPSVWGPLGALGALLLVFGTTGKGPARWFDSGAPLNVAPRTQTNTKATPAARRAIPTKGVRRKGHHPHIPDFLVYRHRNKASELIHPKMSFRGKDLLGMQYNSRGFRYLLVILIDQKGEISWLYPSTPGSSTPITDAGRLPGSVELDDAPGREKLMAFFSSQPLQVDEVKQLLQERKQSGFLSLPNQPSQTIYLHLHNLQKK